MSKFINVKNKVLPFVFVMFVMVGVIWGSTSFAKAAEMSLDDVQEGTALQAGDVIVNAGDVSVFDGGNIISIYYYDKNGKELKEYEHHEIKKSQVKRARNVTSWVCEKRKATKLKSTAGTDVSYIELHLYSTEEFEPGATSEDEDFLHIYDLKVGDIINEGEVVSFGDTYSAIFTIYHDSKLAVIESESIGQASMPYSIIKSEVKNIKNVSKWKVNKINYKLEYTDKYAELWLVPAETPETKRIGSIDANLLKNIHSLKVGDIINEGQFVLFGNTYLGVATIYHDSNNIVIQKDLLSQVTDESLDFKIKNIKNNFEWKVSKINYVDDSHIELWLVPAGITSTPEITSTTETSSLENAPYVSSPKTGDQAQIALFVVMFVLSGISLMVFVSKKKSFQK